MKSTLKVIKPWKKIFKWLTEYNLKFPINLNFRISISRSTSEVSGERCFSTLEYFFFNNGTFQRAFSRHGGANFHHFWIHWIFRLDKGGGNASQSFWRWRRGLWNQLLDRSKCSSEQILCTILSFSWCNSIIVNFFKNLSF